MNKTLFRSLAYICSGFHPLYPLTVRTNTSSETRKAERTKGTAFGSSAIFTLKIRRFPPLPRGRFGIVGRYNMIIHTVAVNGHRSMNS
jgi:hypothetical protein